jgi:phospholipase C
MLVISPWSRGGWVCSQVFDHTSVIRFLEARFGVREENISDWRRTVCGDLTAAFDFKTPNKAPPATLATISADLALPNQAEFDAYKAVVGSRPNPVAPPNPPKPKVERGVRNWRPLPYSLAIDVRLVEGDVELTFVNDGQVGASFYVSDRLTPKTSPRRFTVGAGRSISDRWNAADGRYALIVHGPAGFYRSFECDERVVLEVRLRHRATGGVKLHLHNWGLRPLEVDVGDRYGRSSQTAQLPPRAKLTRSFDLERSAQWYDIAVSTRGLVHRFVGHVETGRAALSAPASE